jgi:hypothetical protein
MGGFFVRLNIPLGLIDFIYYMVPGSIWCLVPLPPPLARIHSSLKKEIKKIINISAKIKYNFILNIQQELCKVKLYRSSDYSQQAK